ncbi:hypothetical protein [Beggiatoa leptomitoformis]|uniref:Uncharacterized protein n=1 Tax=Beggiatoa leptomitoformis TaxID=288004 RepID=A0A2N9YHH5_9GAMM|nr:hypothetical protein [Beggiatoa leptomitoformis]ALG67900.1 hypothetical protein AL038_09480 [Beggiatoa leptomitoformis]AUI69835.1 hypothetical protein BLE401_14800 [Beggiatoa leptomitoformis]
MAITTMLGLKGLKIIQVSKEDVAHVDMYDVLDTPFSECLFFELGAFAGSEFVIANIGYGFYYATDLVANIYNEKGYKLIIVIHNANEEVYRKLVATLRYFKTHPVTPITDVIMCS